LKTDIVADAKHADHANQDVAVSGAQAGDERGGRMAFRMESAERR
jgi:hypothetical protein